MTLQMKFEHYRADLLERPAERLVVTGIRCWMAGYEYGDIDCWEAAWREYSNALGTSDARSLIGELQNLVRTLRDVSNRTISCYPHCCRHVCRDECMAISLISAHQYQNSKAVRVAAHYLTNLDRCPALDQLD